MRGLSLGLMLLFGLCWLAVALADLALPYIAAVLPAGAGTGISVVLDWAMTQTTMATGLSITAWFCALTGGRGWAALGLAAILPLLALAVLQFDPRILAAAQDTIGPAFNDLRAAQPQIRLGLFTGLALIGAARLLAPASGTGRAVAPAVVLAWGAIALAGGPASLLALALPGLLVAVLALAPANRDRPAGPYILIGLACLLAGLALMAAGAGPRQDLRGGFVAVVLLAACAHRWQPRLSAPVLWGHALLLGAALAWLAPGLQQLAGPPAALSFAEIGAALRRAEALRSAVSLGLALWVLLGLAVLRRRRLRPPLPTPG